jgi:YidC/Oxa1 family membrane protein insertase
MQQKRLIPFVALMVAFFGLWYAGKVWLFPQPEKPPEEKPADFGFWDFRNLALLGTKEPPKPVRDGALHLALGPWDMAPVHEAARQAANAALEKTGTRIPLGSKDRDSKFHLFVELDSRGACVRSVWLNKFQACDENGKPADHQLELVPSAANKQTGSYLLFHFAGKNAEADKLDARPVATLGVENWKPSATEASSDETGDGRQRQTVSFSKEVNGVVVTKTFTLVEGEYHVGLEVRLELAPGAKGPRKFRYQFTGPHGLPIEGRWFTGTFRNAMIGRADADNYVRRELETSQQIGVWGGGPPVLREEGKFIRYAGVAIQYFFSGLVVAEQEDEHFLTRARPTLESGLAKGKIKSISDDGSKLVLAVNEKNDKQDETYYFAERGEGLAFKGAVGQRVAVRHYTDPLFRPSDQGGPRSLIKAVEMDPDKFPAVWEDDITVRVATDVLEVDYGKPVVHKYLLYNGPVKPMLLGFATDAGQVPDGLVDLYEGRGLNTLTDSPSPGMMGKISGTIGWTWVLIKCTNLMHRALNLIHTLLAKVPWLPSYGLSIIVLTVLVRGMMFPISRKGALTSIRMQELAPEIKKLQEKYKDDRQQLQLATMELYRKSGVNPFGTCWFMLLQMPIFMGLYFSLQESITFRLAPFQPAAVFGLRWIDNLAAPDMLVYWSESIPWLSRPQDFGGFLYLGPYLNILPIFAVALMIMQQKLITPPPTDEQQEMQQKMMKYMMIFMGLMFYKVAAGLCIYFIASSLWGFAERKLLPKKKPAAPGTGATTAPPSNGLLNRVFGGATAAGSSTAVTTEAPGRPRQGRNKRGKVTAAPPADGGGSVLARLRRRLSEWWADVLKEASKKQR